jgi:hypothetical protein
MMLNVGNRRLGEQSTPGMPERVNDFETLLIRI